MNTAFLVINVILLLGVAVYAWYSRNQLKEEQEKWFEKRKLLDSELAMQKDELDKIEKSTKSKSEYIITESENVANEIIESLQQILGKHALVSSIVLPDSESYDLKFQEIKEAVKKSYTTHIESLLSQVERFEEQKAEEVVGISDAQVEQFAESFQKFKSEQLEKFEKSFETFKREEEAQFENKVKTIVHQAALEILGHSLTQPEHEELVKNAIRKAKEANGL